MTDLHSKQYPGLKYFSNPPLPQLTSMDTDELGFDLVDEKILYQSHDLTPVEIQNNHRTSYVTGEPSDIPSTDEWFRTVDKTSNSSHDIADQHIVPSKEGFSCANLGLNLTQSETDFLDSLLPPDISAILSSHVRDPPTPKPSLGQSTSFEEVQSPSYQGFTISVHDDDDESSYGRDYGEYSKDRAHTPDVVHGSSDEAYGRRTTARNLLAQETDETQSMIIHKSRSESAPSLSKKLPRNVKSIRIL